MAPRKPSDSASRIARRAPRGCASSAAPSSPWTPSPRGRRHSRHDWRARSSVSDCDCGFCRWQSGRSGRAQLLEPAVHGRQSCSAPTWRISRKLPCVLANQAASRSRCPQLSPRWGGLLAIPSSARGSGPRRARWWRRIVGAKPRTLEARSRRCCRRRQPRRAAVQKVGTGLFPTGFHSRGQPPRHGQGRPVPRLWTPVENSPSPTISVGNSPGRARARRRSSSTSRACSCRRGAAAILSRGYAAAGRGRRRRRQRRHAPAADLDRAVDEPLMPPAQYRAPSSPSVTIARSPRPLSIARSARRSACSTTLSSPRGGPPDRSRHDYTRRPARAPAAVRALRERHRRSRARARCWSRARLTACPRCSRRHAYLYAAAVARRAGAPGAAVGAAAAPSPGASVIAVGGIAQPQRFVDALGRGVCGGALCAFREPSSVPRDDLSTIAAALAASGLPRS